MEDFDVTSYFFDSVELLRSKGDIILHSTFIKSSEDEDEYVTAFLKQEYEKEASAYPGVLPPYNGSAALWGAKTVFVASQLLMLRDIPELEFPKLLPNYDQEVDLSAILSCDLCLRFLPDIIEKAEDIDTFDGLIPLLDSVLLNWSYSQIGRRMIDLDQQLPNIDPLKCKEMKILLAERIVQRNAQHSIPKEIREIVKPYLETDL